MLKDVRFGDGNNLTGEILPDKEVRQSFEAKYEHLDSVTVNFATFMRTNTSRMVSTILDSKKNIVARAVFSTSKLKDNSYFRIPFNTLLIPGAVYEFRLESKGSHSGNSVTAKWGKSRNRYSKLIVSGKVISGELDCRFSYDPDGTGESPPVLDLLSHDRNVLREFLDNDNRKLSIIILTKDGYDLISRCLEMIQKHVKYPYEIIIGDTGSSDPRVFGLYESLKCDCTVVKNMEYHFSKCNNELAFNHASGGFLLFMNNDIFLSEDSVSMAMKYALNNRIGTVGIRLVKPNGLIDHDGQIIIDGSSIREPDHVNVNRPACDVRPINGYVDGNTGAFMITRADLFKKAGGFDERYSDIYQDCDYAVWCRNNGYLHYNVRQTQALHMVSATRGALLTNKTASSEREKLYAKWNGRMIPDQKKPIFSFVTCVNDSLLYTDFINSVPREVLHEVEFIPIKNKDNRFTVTQALNVGGELARGRFIVYCHQDIILGKDWIYDVFECLNSVDQDKLGIAGFEGLGRNHVPYSASMMRPGHKFEVLTLDELCLITNKRSLRFDESFRFHYYGADICCEADTRGLKNYVIGGKVSHRSGGDGNILKDPDSFKIEAFTFWKKWTGRYDHVATTTTKFSPKGPHFMICPSVLNKGGNIDP